MLSPAASQDFNQGADMIIVSIKQVRMPFCENYVYLAYRFTGIYH